MSTNTPNKRGTNFNWKPTPRTDALALIQEVFMLRGTLRELLKCMDTHEDALTLVEYEAFRLQYDDAEKSARNALLTTDYHDAVTVIKPIMATDAERAEFVAGITAHMGVANQKDKCK